MRRKRLSPSEEDRGANAPAAGGPVVLVNIFELDGNPYLRLWNDAARRAGASLVPLSKRAVLARGADTPSWVHLQWPDRTLLYAKPVVAASHAAKLLALVLVARARRARVMVTAHNVWSHDRIHPLLEAWFWAILGRLTTDLHLLSLAGRDEFLGEHPTFAKATIREIPHGNYDPEVRYAPTQTEARGAFGLPARGTVLVTFGRLRAYKGVDELVDAFRGVGDSDMRLVIAGRVVDEDLRRRLDVACRHDSRIVLIPRFLAEAEIHRLVRAADAVVLPYRRVLNSGSALLALSLGRPVVVPNTPTFTALRNRIGERWVSLYEAAIGSGDLAQTRNATDERPDLSWCSWETITAQLERLWLRPAAATPARASTQRATDAV